MQEQLKVKKAGAGSIPEDEAPETIEDGPVAFNGGDYESAPPDIIIEK